MFKARCLHILNFPMISMSRVRGRVCSQQTATGDIPAISGAVKTLKENLNPDQAILPRKWARPVISTGNAINR
jgi:hypothetical protein